MKKATIAVLLLAFLFGCNIDKPGGCDPLFHPGDRVRIDVLNINGIVMTEWLPPGIAQLRYYEYKVRFVDSSGNMVDEVFPEDCLQPISDTIE